MLELWVEDRFVALYTGVNHYVLPASSLEYVVLVVLPMVYTTLKGGILRSILLQVLRYHYYYRYHDTT
ncbi:MAG: hypothetical protein DRO40_10170 [Thermoprotei archaeon]|nr:MAG: hypothetical protein DRO40_10170 [Thermoprotei archaeon]